MSTKPSTAALDSIVSQRFFRCQRRAPRHPARGRLRSVRHGFISGYLGLDGSPL
jgi:hypothetical protein